MIRARRAAALGLSYDEYTLEILERGRYLQASDTDRIAAIKAKRTEARVIAPQQISAAHHTVWAEQFLRRLRRLSQYPHHL